MCMWGGGGGGEFSFVSLGQCSGLETLCLPDLYGGLNEQPPPLTHIHPTCWIPLPSPPPPPRPPPSTPHLTLTLPCQRLPSSYCVSYLYHHHPPPPSLPPSPLAHFKCLTSTTTPTPSATTTTPRRPVENGSPEVLDLLSFCGGDDKKGLIRDSL